ncbi:hypothetical protein NMY22_g19094 [Coprinellus aureogranulatus]|nr:hypothetical protein NMY22_g19094 [Coprinellus aureogranulatus]
MDVQDVSDLLRPQDEDYLYWRQRIQAKPLPLKAYPPPPYGRTSPSLLCSSSIRRLEKDDSRLVRTWWVPRAMDRRLAISFSTSVDIDLLLSLNAYPLPPCNEPRRTLPTSDMERMEEDQFSGYGRASPSPNLKRQTRAKEPLPLNSYPPSLNSGPRPDPACWFLLSSARIRIGSMFAIMGLISSSFNGLAKCSARLELPRQARVSKRSRHTQHLHPTDLTLSSTYRLRQVHGEGISDRRDGVVGTASRGRYATLIGVDGHEDYSTAYTLCCESSTLAGGQQTLPNPDSTRMLRLPAVPSRLTKVSPSALPDPL